jgi:hypothetical protein
MAAWANICTERKIRGCDHLVTDSGILKSDAFFTPACLFDRAGAHLAAAEGVVDITRRSSG